MVIAATKSLLKPLRLDDRAGRLREKLIIECLEAERTQKIHNSLFLGHFAVAGAKHNDEWFKTNIEAAIDSLDSVLDLNYPWVPRLSGEEKRKREGLKDMELWEAIYGKYDDPETQAKLQATLDQLSEL